MTADLQPIDLRAETAVNPLGIDRPHPHLSWKLVAARRGARQVACRVLVAIDADPLEPSSALVWDSGTVPAGAGTGVAYGGQPLVSRTCYVWRVLVSGSDGQRSAWSAPATWETGLLEPTDWSARWVGAPWDVASGPWPSLDGRQPAGTLARIWVPRLGGGAPMGRIASGRFRTRFRLPGGRKVLGARMVAAGARTLELALNAEIVSTDRAGGQGSTAVVADVTPLVRPGANVLAVAVDATGSGPPGLIAGLEVWLEGAPAVTVLTSSLWRAAADGPDAPDGWRAVDFDDTAWQRAEAVGLHGDPPWGREPVTYRPSPYLRREFRLGSPVRRARLYATALGVYELHLNGRRVGADHLAPGWTDYARRVPYQCYDVTDLVQVGDNAVGTVLGDGWYAGHICWFGPFHYGRSRLALVQLEVEHQDGSVTRIDSDSAWQAGQGSIRYADLQNGEVHDQRLEPEGWATAGFDATGWAPVVRAQPDAGRLVAQVAPPIRVHQEVRARSVREPRPGTFVIDFGQNLVGWVRLRATAAAGTRVVLRHAEVLAPDGTLSTANLRTARQTDEYTFAGGEHETFEPRFTVHGFRYLEVTGYPGRLEPDAVVARVAYADTEPTGEFACSDTAVNRLHENIIWSQRGNFLTVPTDCPQRDERLGWTADAQVFAATAAFIADMRTFFAKWLHDVVDAQLPNGAITHVAPDVADPSQPDDPELRGGSPGWGDAVVIVPWELYRAYGDTRAARESFDAILGWLDHLERGSRDGVRPATGFGDWLSVDAETPKDLIATAFFAYTAKLTADLAQALGRQDVAGRCATLFAQVREAFRDAYVRGGAELAGGTQTAYVMALHVGLLDEVEAPRAAERLVADIEARNWHLSTGFLGTPWLLPVLTRTGYVDVAYRLLLQDTFPSWLYPVVHGDATTVWERWDSWSDHRGLQDPAMNSFNHYAYGAVGDWLHRTVAGIDASAPGYREIRVRPRTGGGLSWARAAYDSVHGRIASAWRDDGSTFTLEVAIPPDTTATIFVPGHTPAAVTESDVPADAAEGVTFDRLEDDCVVFRVGSGTYRFRSPHRDTAGA